MPKRRILLSKIARDPEVAAFLSRGERDAGSSHAVTVRKPVKTGGEAVKA